MEGWEHGALAPAGRSVQRLRGEPLFETGTPPSGDVPEPSVLSTRDELLGGGDAMSGSRNRRVLAFEPWGGGTWGRGRGNRGDV